MPRLLIVSPHFPPVNTPDMQRVRMSLPYFVDAGWEVVVLTVDDRQPLAPVEPDLLATVPRPVRVVRTGAFSRNWSRYLGMNNLGLRTLPHLYLRGRQLLKKEAFDLVYFSTTQFIVCVLGRVWHMEFDTPYVIDLQDPWLSDYYQQPGAPPPPGGWKYHFSHALAKHLERWTLRQCAHVVSVSGHYLLALRQRYRWFHEDSGSVLTFGAPDEDFAVAREKRTTAPALLPATASIKIAYAGRLGPDMRPALDVLFAAIARFKDAPRPFELFFFGTSYAPAGQGAASTTDLAARHGISHLVHEKTARIGYIDSLRIMLETDLALLLGSEDRAYSPSKVYPTLLASRPTLAVAPANSVLEAKIQELGGAALITFAPGAGGAADAAQNLSALLAGFAGNPGRPLGAPPQLAVLEQQYSAAAIARRQLEVFNRLIARSRTTPPPLPVAEYWPTLPPLQP
ncbi:glycosyltransferase [Opitutus sp. GAS368]|uniref:glycosyltransferase n=1 Tax=Opitutus sp. GAS368 TaxID=1882749 RepID=UPI00087C02FD|nr:glycosyltransferase [Opitutus sp. GAS368]SDS64054.1 Glycosyl transferase 4-like domain-containing protein [Opitutus sp. GAS368]